MAVYFGVFALFLCFVALGILLWWQFSLYKDYKTLDLCLKIQSLKKIVNI